MSARFRYALGLLAQGDGELVLAGRGRVVEGFGRAVSLGGFEEKAALDAIRKSREASFAIGVGADFEVELARVHESVGDVDFDLGGINRGASFVVDREVDGAGADVAIDDRNGLGIGSLPVSRK